MDRFQCSIGIAKQILQCIGDGPGEDKWNKTCETAMDSDETLWTDTDSDKDGTDYRRVCCRRRGLTQVPIKTSLTITDCDVDISDDHRSRYRHYG